MFLAIFPGKFFEFCKKNPFFLANFSQEFFSGQFLAIFEFLLRGSRNSLAGWQFVDGFQKQCSLTGLLAHQWVLRNTLSGSKTVVSISRDATVPYYMICILYTGPRGQSKGGLYGSATRIPAEQWAFRIGRVVHDVGAVADGDVKRRRRACTGRAGRR